MEGRSKKSQIYDNMPRNSNCPAKLNELESMGLVSYDKHALNNVTFVELTPTGKIVAQNLLNVQNILSGEMIIDSDPNSNHDVFSEKRDITSDESINHSVPNSIPSPICPVKPTLIEILIAVHDNPGITKDDLTIKINKGNIKNAMQEAIDKQYLFKAVTGSSDIAPKYYITVGGIDHIGSRVFMKNGEDVVEMDCNAPSKPENTAR